MPECPYCGKWFRTKKGLQQHITKTHYVKLPGGGKMIDPTTIDILGKMEREAERAKRRQQRKKSSGGFDIDIGLPDILGGSSTKKKSRSKKRSSSKKSSSKKSSSKKRR
ncbi:C2H2-type zinc finger protein [Thermococcus sp. GR4]|uniref:C2H2-type zinc finger protein n=1 Tax=Thermococcus sp. GR4 TaxID=1638254 RepID=UPI00142FB5E1|nr:C2H2-type zinc finger protein [Thermococcus sp. GR4]NJE79577.1 hypothetical protein [Thermococcus sp. GR4]